MDSLKGKTAVITGSAKGIGAGIARYFAECGAHVVINFRRSDSEARKLHETINRNGGVSLVVKADVSKPLEAEHLIETAINKLGKVDILINNAGEFLYKSVDTITANEWHSIIENNLHSTFYCIKAALEDMRKRKWGRIINIADMDADKISIHPMKTPYMISKTGMLLLTRSIAAAVASYGITVNAVSPGYIDSGNYSESFKQHILDKIPLGRLGTPEDIAQTAAFLASDEAAYITGANIAVTGGAQ